MNAPSSSHPRFILTATPRPLETEGNLFVRLTPRTASRLASSLLLSPSPSHDDCQNDIAGGTSREVPAVEFLPLEIVFCRRGRPKSDGAEDDDGDNIAVYASYNGGAPASLTSCHSPLYGSTDNDNIIELPIDLHPSLQSVFNSTSEPVLVSVRPLSNVAKGETVTFEPLTISDWEMIEMEASVLEDGGLLNQITVVFPGQVFPLRLGGHLSGLESAAWIRVMDNFGMPSNQKMEGNDLDESDESFTSDSEFDSSIDDDEDFMKKVGDVNRHQCVRLMAETEVIVIPKTRLRKGDPVEKEKPNEHSLNGGPIYSPSAPLRVQPTLSDVAHSISMAEDSSSLPNPLLGSACVHPVTLTQLPGYIQCNEIQSLPMVVTIMKASGPYAKYSPQHEAGNKEGTGCGIVVATIHASNSMHEGHIGMHSFLRHQLGVSPLTDWVSVQLWSKYHVTSSINGVRRGLENIKIAKISTTAPPDKPSSHPWTLPDKYCNLVSPTTPDVDYSTCEDCRGKGLGKEGRMLSPSVAATRDEVYKSTLFFSSGSVVPAELLRNLGLDWLGNHSSCMFIIKLEPMSDSSDVSTNDNEYLPLNTSQLVPIFTGGDLNELSGTEPENYNLLETQDLSPVLSFSDESTVGFSHAIHRVMQSVSEIISYGPNSGATSISFAQESIHKHAIMITGEEGSGKSHLSIASSSKLSLSELCATVYLDCRKLQATSSSIQFILEEIQQSFQEAIHNQPSVLVLDDLDYLIPNVECSDSEGDGSIHHQQLNPLLATQTKIIVDHLLLQSHHCHRSSRLQSPTKSTGVILICTCRDKDSLSIRYQESGVFHSSVEVPSLESSQRAQLLRNHLFRNMSTSPNDGISHVISRLGKDTDGFRPRDLKTVSTRILHLDYLRSFNQEPDGCLAELEGSQKFSLRRLESDIASTLEDYAPLSQKLVDIDHNLYSMDWASIGGLHQAKQSLHNIIIHPMMFMSVYDNAPMELPTGVLLYGPPGNGKSFIAPFLAKKSKLNLITCRGPELLDRYIGASEAKVRQLFARATAAAPSMIFFDEFDSLAPQRGSDHTGVTDRVVNQLLTLLDGAERSKKTSHVFVIAATSRPDKIDKALLRPGRLEKHVYVGYPESILEWNSLFSSLLQTRIVDEEVSRIQQDGDLFNSFCKDCGYARDFSAADMKAVLDTSHLLCVHDLIDASNEVTHGPAILGKCHILEAFRRTRPSLLPKERLILQNIYSAFGSNQIEEASSDHPHDHRLKTSLR